MISPVNSDFRNSLQSAGFSQCIQSQALYGYIEMSNTWMEYFGNTHLNVPAASSMLLVTGTILVGSVMEFVS